MLLNVWVKKSKKYSQLINFKGIHTSPACKTESLSCFNIGYIAAGAI